MPDSQAVRVLLVACIHFLGLWILLISPSHGQGNIGNFPPVFDFDTVGFSVPENFNTSSNAKINPTLPITAFDTEGDNITYYIPEGALGSDKFIIETVYEGTSFNGYIYFIPGVALDREHEDELQLKVQATDGLSHGSAPDPMLSVIVTLLDVNDNSPMFNNLDNVVNIPEDKDTNAVVFTVSASDPDTGKNKQIGYNITASNPPSGLQKFVVNAYSGEVHLTQSVDFEEIQQYVLSVEAKDKGDIPMADFGLLTVNIEDVNDQNPIFDQSFYEADILENATQGEIVVTVTASDGDKGINDPVVYFFNSSVSAIDGVPSFAINPSSGVVTVNSASLDREQFATYSLTVLVSEMSELTRTAQTSLLIRVLDINDNRPEFGQPSYNATISETADLGTSVIEVIATDKDINQNALFLYELRDIDSSFVGVLPFNISSNGLISVAVPLDYESIQSYKFEVHAVETEQIVTPDPESGSADTVMNSNLAVAIVNVNVINKNDNAPVFLQSSYSPTISENIQIGGFVVQVEAVDDDYFPFGDVTYSLVDSLGNFIINDTTGAIRTNATVDYEIDQTFSFSVVASDSEMMQQVAVYVTVININDNMPVVIVNGSTDVAEVTVSVEEAQSTGLLVFVVEATDADNNMLQYSIVSQSPNASVFDFQFKTDEPNQLVTAVPLDYEKFEVYTLILLVTDGVFNDTILVTVNVVDENDNSPIFVNGTSSYSFFIVENEPASTMVGKVEATDNDSGTFGTVNYNISGIGYEDFIIDSMSGVITTAVALDRERKELYNLVLMAYDLDESLPRSNTIQLSITVLDENDNTPKFSAPLYEQEVVENVATVEIVVAATDDDIGNNMKIKYIISDGNSGETFVIDGDAGVIRRNASVDIDREVWDQFELTVVATDAGMPQRSSNATVLIDILDINDNSPSFDNLSITVNIPEDIGIGELVYSAMAFDPDYGSNSELTYQLMSDSETLNHFQLESSSSGDITTTNTFDYDMGQKSFGMIIKAEDNGATPKTGETTLTVNIVDVNDNPPLFTKVSYTKSVPENMTPGESIVTVAADDADDGLNKIITYSIVQATVTDSSSAMNGEGANGTFSLDSVNGALYLTAMFDYELVKGYTIVISGVDAGTPPQSASTTVLITITDFNDNDPEFMESSYWITFFENSTIGTTDSTLVGEVTDLDSGSNALLNYSVLGTTVFTINEKGVLKLSMPLDYESVDYFQFVVIVMDMGTIPRKSSTMVNVTVVDSNDNSPVFQFPAAPGFSLPLQVPEGNYSLVKHLLTRVNATDLDSGPLGSVEYSITSGNDEFLFLIEPFSGSLYVIDVLNREEKDSYSLTITAKDQGYPPRTAIATIFLTVLDINEFVPVFQQLSYSAVVSENTPAGYELVTVSAMDFDLAENGTFTFSLDDYNYFSINETTGVITTNSSLDYETVQNLSTVVIVSDNGPVSLMSTALFITYITDVNDNPPVFLKDYYGLFFYAEDTALGTVIASILASDKDSGVNGAITYTLANGQGNFMINSTGHIIISSSLDRETTGFYDLAITAVDHGSFIQLSSTATLNVSITDVNDNAPVFNSNLYTTLEFPENSTEGTLVATMNVTDADVGINSEVFISIFSGNELNHFRVETVKIGTVYVGYVFVNKALDYEQMTSYFMSIKAKDNGTVPKETTVSFSVSVMNINDNYPVFSSTSYTFEISEDAVLNSPVGTFVASDNDIGSFGKISGYSFPLDVSTHVNNTFAISPVTGVITVIAPLDYDSGPKSYSFSVVATDGGGLKSTSTVLVNVINTNEFQPNFGATLYNGTVLENLDSPQTITTVKATEGDDGSFGTIEYSIIEGDPNERFAIGSSDGIITTTTPLDREEQEIYILRIQARDQGLPPQSGFTQVQVTILDSNDNAPDFGIPSERFEYLIPEDTTVPAIVMPTISATDLDAGSNGVITYSLSGEESGSFVVNNSTGVITLNSELDRETIQNYTFDIVATDGGSPSNPTALEIIVFVLDSNDKAPIFTEESYAAIIAENAVNGNLVIGISAVDDDFGSNSQVFYHIFEIKGVALSESPFTMSSDGSLLTTSVVLDYETLSYYEVTVAATDSGVPPQTSYVQVNISVQDVNDHFPVFQQSPYTVSIKEGNVGPTTVFLLDVVAVDNDGTSPNNVVKYDITAGNEQNVFFIDPDSGSLFAGKLLDYEVKESYVLTILATDQPTNTTNARSNSTQVIISLIDINDNAPVFQPSIYSVAEEVYAGYILENASVSTEILYVQATDEDSGSFGKVSYSFIAPSSTFFINQTSGVIYVIGTLDSEGISQYNLTVIASDQDQNDPPLIDQALVTIEVLGVNDNAPKFVSSIYYSTIPEESAPDVLVLNLNAIDLDSDDLVYTIISGNERNYFKINASSGTVTVKNPPDREISEVYTLVVVADDGMQNVSTMLQITLEDINDNAPRFGEDHYYTLIEENVLGGAPVPVYNAVDGNATLIEAKDADKLNTVNSKVVYKTSGMNKDLLSIDPTTGILTVSSATVFNYEANQTIDVMIIAIDSAGPLDAMSSTVTLTILLQDINDVSPQFTSSTYAATLSEGTPNGTILPVNIKATDVDTGLGGVVSYFITHAAPLLYLEEFQINETTGEVKLTGSLDRESAEMIEITIAARDNITPFLSASAQLIITITDINDNAPDFDSQYYFIEVAEDIDVGDEVTTIVALDQDIAANAIVVYNIFPHGQKLKVNQGTGLISTLVKLDHETEPLFEVIVQACDMGTDQMCTNATIEVTVTDINDGIPTFDYPTYLGHVCNDSYPVMSVMRLVAWDTDSGSNGVVQYTGSGNTGGLFAVVPSTGEVELISSLMTTHIGQTYLFNIIAADSGNPSQSSTASVQITICDESAAPIKFNQTNYFSAISENKNAPAFLLSVLADAQFPPVTYSILKSNISLLFQMSPNNGDVFTTEVLDSEIRNLYSLVVEAQDNASVPNIAYTTVIVAVINVNDNPPKFLLAPYFFTTTENQDPPVVIDTTVAIDPDIASGESNITYKIVPSSDPMGVFGVGVKNGVIVANQQLDRELQEIYSIMIEAKDSDASDPRTATTAATITVTDINDNSPAFEQNVYTVFISENQPPNSVIASAEATDSDLGDNSVITYSIVEGDTSTFTVDPNTGTITLLTILDYEMKTFYNLTVMAVDNGSPPLNSTAVVEVTVEDYNDCIPQFTSSQYTVERFENSTIGTVIGNFSDTSDCDSGLNGEVDYSILTGNEGGLFSLEETTGILTLLGQLDHETKDIFVLKVQSKDKGTPSLHSSVLLMLVVLDVNDETPMFASENYDVEISEGISSQFQVVVVAATDGDSTTNGQLLYSFESGNEDNHFSIGEVSGAIVVAATSLDRETYDSYLLVVVATDKGMPPRSSNVTVSITLTDVNDNIPVITNLPYTASLKENVSEYVVYMVNATDADIGVNQELFFSLENYQNLFSIDASSGQVSRLTTVTLDYEQATLYDLSITVRDSGKPQSLSAHGTLTVEIIDIDDNPPIFTQEIYEEQILENLPAGTIVTVVSTDDDDTLSANTRASYHIINCSPCGNMSLFDVDTASGTITTTTSLDRESVPQYILTVVAVNDESEFLLSSTTKVKITVVDVNDETPSFNQTSYESSISELASNQTYILTVFATDGDEALKPNSKITYGHTAIKNNPFLLGNTTGILTLFGELDREGVSAYYFDVIATDEGIPNKLSSMAKVTITINDENDNKPTFINGDLISRSIEENVDMSKLPLLLVILEFRDIDIGSNNGSVYNISQVLNGTSTISDESLITLQQLNGSSVSLLLNAPLDYETTPELSISVTVTNQQPAHPSLCTGGNSECYLSDSTVVLINVVDANDNPPVFLKASYSGQISTETPTGTIVLNVTAIDVDTGTFGTVKYQLVEGNSAKFRIDEATGHIITRGTFENDDEVSFDIEVVAYDNFGNDPSFSSTVSVRLLALKDFRRVLIIFGLPISEFTEDKINRITEILENMTGYQIVVEELREHVLDSSGDVDPSKTDLIFHALDPNSNEIVDFDTFIANLDEEIFLDAVQECRPEKITSLLDEFTSSPLDSIMIFLIILCSILTFGAIVTLFMAFQQRYISLHDKRKELVADVFYGSPSSSLALDGMPRDMSALEAFEMKGAAVKHSEMYVRPYDAFGGLDTSGLSSSVGELSSIQEDNPLYEEQEIRMEMFQGSDNETEGDLDEEQLLAAALQDEDEDDEDNSTTAI